MEVSRVEVRPGVWLTHLREDKFKTACFSVSLLSQLSRDTAAMNALIPFVLRRGTRLYPDMEALNARFEELYGTAIEPSVRRIGEIQCSGFYASFPEDDFLPKGESVLKEALELTFEMLLSPVTRGGLFLPAYVESERDNLLDLIASRLNNKRAYALTRCLEEMCCCEDFAVSRYGDEETCRSINYKKLSRHYKAMLQEAPLELFYCGRASLDRVRRLLRGLLAPLPRGEVNTEIGTEIRMNALADQPRYTEEQMDVAQANLVIGWRLGECMEDPDFPALYVFNDLFGGSPSSRLFLNVREKLSLCYYASSIIDVRKGLLLVSSGIQEKNYDAAKEEIFSQLEALQRGAGFPLCIPVTLISGDGGSHIFQNAFSLVKRDVLRQERNAQATSQSYLSFVRFQLSGQNGQKSGLSGAVDPHDSDAVRIFYANGDIRQDIL